MHDLTGTRRDGDRGRVPLPGLGTIGGLVERPEGGPLLWFGYTDHTTPQHIYRFDARDGLGGARGRPARAWCRCRTSSPSRWPTPAPTAPRCGCSSSGGRTPSAASTAAATTAPVPTILYGYGGFGVSLNPAYSASILAWVEAGGVYAIANLRGGCEEGETWHRAGMLGNKQHVFDDFHAAATTLVDRRRHHCRRSCACRAGPTAACWSGPP